MLFGGILAGGIGVRMETAGGLPKQFLEIGGKPVIVRTLLRFFEVKELDGVMVAMHPSWHDYSLDLLSRNGIDVSRVTIVPGGATRFESLVNLAKACVAAAEDAGDAGETLMISHDCARPFVTSEILRTNVAATAAYDMVTTSVPTIDTVLLSADGQISDCVPERSTVFLDQGPQTMRVRHFLSLVAGLSAAEREKYMEAGQLYIDKGFRVGIVPGSRCNFKLTTPFDLKLAELLIREGVLA